MKTSEFTKPNGTISANAEFPTFIPKLLPPNFAFSNALTAKLALAHERIGKLYGLGANLPNADLLILPYLWSEAVYSSKIEGTTATIRDMLKHEMSYMSVKQLQKLRANEVINYKNALELCLKRIKSEPITCPLIQDAHKELMMGVRGGDDNPGQFRKEQNCIVINATNEIIFVPPPYQLVDKLLGNLESFINNPPKDMSVLIQCAIMHYQFEVIHPFMDGNGRIGRLLISLLLAKTDMLPKPFLYLSGYFDEHKERYSKLLLSLSQKSNWTQWISFFLDALITQSDLAIKNINELLHTRAKYFQILDNISTTAKTRELVDHLFENPYITILKAQQYLNTTYPTARDAVNRLVDVGILAEISKDGRQKQYVAEEIINSLDPNRMQVSDHD